MNLNIKHQSTSHWTPTIIRIFNTIIINMKIIFCLTFVIALTLAEPPSYRQQFQHDRPTYYVAKQQEESPEAEVPEDSPSDAPYSPSGWKPDGPEFELPQKQQQQQQILPNKKYGAPSKIDNQYGTPAPTPQRQYGASMITRPRQYVPPQQNYGAPQATTTDQSSTTDYEESTTLSSTLESQNESVNGVNELDETGDSNEQQRQSGEYFIALPDGRLQRVQYISSQNIEAMKYFAKIRAENVEPLRGPIYAYQPLQKLQFAPTQLQVQAIDEYVGPIVPAVASEVREKNIKSGKIVKTSSAVSSSSSSSSSSSTSSLSAAKLQIQPLAAELPGAPLSTSYTTYMANYQIPNAEQRYFISF